MSIEISLDTLSHNFTNHLTLRDNHRVIFSGIFGIGKTYFLKKFFTDNSDYNSIHLTPVNYSISANEDIFNLIKYDILYEILGYDDFDFTETELPNTSIIPSFIESNFNNIISTFLLSIPKIGKSLSGVYKGVSELKQKFEKQIKETGSSDKKKALDFIKVLEQQAGLYENDYYTELISKMLLKISKDNEKKNVLIVDDLDRVDPEHIFRLLNVFAAHFDVDDKKENKFGFDHVIFVFDISNIRKIFQNKYGQGVDFSGYIDKFYSREVFYFDNSEAIKETLRIVISRITIKGIDNDLFSFQYKTSAGNHVYLVLLAMINNHCINLRSLLRLLDQEYEVKRDTVSIFSKNDFNLVRNYSIILALNFLKALFGNSDGLINAIKKLSEVSDAVTTHYNGLGGDYAIGALLLIIDHNNHSLMVGEYEYIDQELNVHYSYRIEFNGLGGQEVSAKVLSAHDLTNGTQKVKELLFFKLLYKAAIVLRNNEDL